MSGPESATDQTEIPEGPPSSPKKDGISRKPGSLRRLSTAMIGIGPASVGAVVGSFRRGYRFIYHPGGYGDDRADIIRAPGGILWLGLMLLLSVSAVHPFLPDFPNGSAPQLAVEIVRLFLAELGVALVVAFVIAWGIDAQARRREENRQEQERGMALERERRLTQDVFRSVLGIQHSSAYVQKVIETTLDRKIIRRQVNLMYSLAQLSEQDGSDLDVTPGHFIWLDQAVSFDFENLSSEEQEIDVRCVVPARHGKLLRNASQVLTTKIGGKDQDVAGALQRDVGGDAKSYVWKHKIGAFKSLAVSFTTRVVKEQSDSDVWTSYYPCTEGITLQVHAPTSLHLGLRNNTASKEVAVIEPNESGMAAWKISGPILPGSGVVFYWRTLEHDGDVGVLEVRDAEGLGIADPPKRPTVGRRGFLRRFRN